jgi:cytochrome c biogenesis protein CcmG/thiol:disulfide interchange protein DsbE
VPVRRPPRLPEGAEQLLGSGVAVLQVVEHVLKGADSDVQAFGVGTVQLALDFRDHALNGIEIVGGHPERVHHVDCGLRVGLSSSFHRTEGIEERSVLRDHGFAVASWPRLHGQFAMDFPSQVSFQTLPSKTLPPGMHKLSAHHYRLRASVLIFALSAASLLGLSPEVASAQPESTEIGKQVPSFEIEALRDSGRAITPSDFKGRYVLLNLWATWCGPCLEKIPALREARRRYSSERLAILNVSFDRSRSKAMAFLEKRGMPGSHARASGGLMGEFGDKFARMPTESASGKVRGLPNLTLVGPKGKVADMAAGESGGVLEMLSEHLPGR